VRFRLSFYFMKKFIYFLAIEGLFVYMGGSFTWKPLNFSTELHWKSIDVLITTRTYWRHDSLFGYCDKFKIENKSLIGDFNDTLCFDGCSYINLISTRVICADFSVYEQWSGGVFSQLHSLPYNIRIESSFSKENWLNTLNGAEKSIAKYIIDLNKRNDNDKINSSPITTMSPIIIVNQACFSSIRIPVQDADRDAIKCRWAENFNLPSSYLDTDSCVIVFKPSQTGLYGVAIQIEDFQKDSISNRPLSSVPLHFLIESTQGESQNCVSEQTMIYFYESTMQDQSCLAVSFNKTFIEMILIYSISPVIELTTHSPYGLIKSDTVKYDKVENVWYVNVTWTPNKDQTFEIFCFKAINMLNFSTPYNCITFAVGTAVSFQNPSPFGLVFPNQTSVFRIESDKPIIRSERLVSNLKIYDFLKNLVKLIYSNSSEFVISNDRKSLIIYPSFDFREKDEYFLKLDRGFVMTDDQGHCALDSNEISDETFWKFKVKDITPPIVTLLNTRRTSQKTTKIEWSFNEESFSTCSLSTPSSIVKVNCNQSSGKITFFKFKGFFVFYL
jgi:hypothetical protein